MTEKRISEITNREQDRIESVKPILAYFIDSHTRVFSDRLQHAAYYSDVIHYRDHDTRLTSVEWTPYMYGMYSADIRSALAQFRDNNAEYKHTMYEGRREIVYLSSPEGVEPPKDMASFLSDMWRDIDGVSTSELGSWAKGTELFSATKYGEVADFDEVYGL